MMWQPVIHYFLHLVFPVCIALLFFRRQWLKAYILLLLTMAVDLDHLLATPMFDACRCSIGFHPLHSYPMIAVYALLLLPRQTRVIAIGLLLHMATDGIDCLFSAQTCA